jgi:fructokinase
MLLVCGEALIDVFVRMEAGLVLKAAAGGSPFNVAMGLGRLGMPTAFLGAISHDVFGDYLQNTLRNAGVSLDFVQRTPKQTTLSIVSDQADGSVRYTFHGQDTADRDLNLADLPKVLSPEIRCVAFGSYSLAVEPVGDTLEHFAHRVGTDRVISLDPNVRPSLIPNREEWRRRFKSLLSRASIVKASDEDIEHGIEPGCDLHQLGQTWRDQGCALVVITRGPKPVLAFGSFGELEVQAPTVDVIDTVGAGDSFHAALLASLHQRSLLSPDALRALDSVNAAAVLDFAASAAAVTCSRRGADMPTWGEVQAFIEASRASSRPGPQGR